MAQFLAEVHVPQGMRRFERARPRWGWVFAAVVAGIFLTTLLLIPLIGYGILFAYGFEGDEFEDDPQALAVLLAFGVLQQATVIAISVAATRHALADFIAGLGLNRWHWTSLWRPALMTVALYIAVALWALFLEWIDIGILDPKSSVDEDFVDGSALIIISFLLIVIGAPLAEEFVFRGAIFGGLLRFGFWPAALVSGGLFGAIHLNLGLFPAFTLVGVAFAYLYYSRGSLWDNIICHGMFNFTSYLLLIAGAE